MSGSTIYALQKTREAVNCLALLDAPLRERLQRAAFTLNVLTVHAIPDAALQEKLLAIVAKVSDAVTADPPHLARLVDDDICGLARELVELFEGCVTEYTKRPKVGGIESNLDFAGD
jgi:hypothetical protein